MKIWQENDAKITKLTKNLQKTQNDEKMHYKITIFRAYAPYPRLIYWIALSISQGKKNDMLSKSRPWLLLLHRSRMLLCSDLELL